MLYSIETKVGDLLGNSKTKEILEKHLPGISNHPQIGMARGFALATAAKYSGGLIPQKMLEDIDSDLKSLVE
ncbi:hypothetical protein PQS90_19970 [Pseudomonas sp. BLCC-B13]|jgi:hypothetical protein|uniref:hypothetical protein n=1 Tax=Pseudomonas sp. BLCC-B13 TaxID=3025314 RepID=UPI00234F1399|nr:hypothetical protein [Pseudomonas sp. BLCC-B13]MDC7827433.1 hypothetical protein [Pseudomonas sp. BLCC-B13]